MRPVLPVLIPEVVGVETTTNQAGYNGTMRLLGFGEHVKSGSGLSWNVQDGQLEPEACRIIGSVTDIVYGQ